MKNLFLRLLLTFLCFVLALKEAYCGGYVYAGIDVPLSQTLSYHSKIKFAVDMAVTSGGPTLAGKWYVYLKCDNPAVAIQNFYNTTSPGIGSIPVRADGFYQLPDISTSFSKIHTIELDLLYDTLAEQPTTATLGIAFYYIGNAKDSVAIDANGDPYQYYCQSYPGFQEHMAKNQSLLSFLPSAIINFADYTLTPTATVCDTIQYSLSEKGKGYSTLSNFIINTDLPSDFTYIPNSSTIKIYNKANQLRTSFSAEPLIQQDTALSWDLSNITQMNMIKTDSTSYFIFYFKILPRPGYNRDSITGTVSATKSSGGTIQKNIPWLILDPSSQPYPIIETLPDSFILTEGYTFILSANTQNTSYTYTWQKDNINLTGGSSREFSLENISQADSGEYRCLVSNNCHQVATNTTIIKVNKVVIIPEEPADPEENNATTKNMNGINNQTLTVYPNPSSGIIYLNISSDVSYTLSDLTGAPIQQGNVNSDGSLNFQSVPSGVYFLQIRQGENLQSVKIFKN